MTKISTRKITGMSEEQFRTIVQVFAGAALLSVLGLGLLPALLAGLLVYQVVHLITPELGRFGILPNAGRAIALIIITLVIGALIFFGISGSMKLLNDESGGLITLMQKMADVVATARERLPLWMHSYLPSDVEGLQADMAEWLRHNASHLSTIGRGIGIGLIYILIGMVIGGMVAITHKRRPSGPAPLIRMLVERVKLLNGSFRRIVFSQVRISAVNTLLTAVFIVVVLPSLGIHLPLKKIIIVVTFVTGLLPVVGNLISNTVIVLVSLGVSSGAAIGSLLFLVAIHKLEYFLNAHIIGTRIRAHAWELLLAMLVMESAFGIEGLVAAPVYYAYLKDELSSRKLL